MIKKTSKKPTNKPVQKRESNDISPSILSMGIIDITFRINFSNKDLELKEEISNNNNTVSYYNIEDFKRLTDLQFLENRKELWDKFELIPNNSTLKHLILANSLRKKKVITEYIGFGTPDFADDEKFFEPIFEHIAKKYNIIFNKTPIKKNIDCILHFEFIHKSKKNNFEVKRSGKDCEDNNENEQNKNKEKNKPVFSSSDNFFLNISPDNNKYNLFYLNYEDLNEFNIQEKDLIELIYFLKKRGAKIFINFYEEEKEQEEEEIEEREEDNDIASEHFNGKSINYIETYNSEEEEEEISYNDSFSERMNCMNNIYYLTDLYFFDNKKAYREFNKHYQFFTSDKKKATVNKGNLYDYFIKGIATGTKDEVEKEKYGFFIEYFNKLYIIKADKNMGNKYEFELKIHPNINHYNMGIIKEYRNIIKRNKNYYISIILSFILGSIIENNSTNIGTLFEGYATGLEIIKKKIELERNNINIEDIKSLNVQLSKKAIDIKVKTLRFTGQENGFILDCTNKEKSELKEYVPLYDCHMINFLKNNKNELQKKGFVSNKGYIISDPQYRKRMKEDEQDIVFDKKEFTKKVEQNIKNIHITKDFNDKIKDPKKEVLKVMIPTKKKIPDGIVGSGKLYEASSKKNKRKSLKNNTSKKTITGNKK